MARWLNIVTAVVSAALAALFLIDCFTGKLIQKTWLACFFLAVATGLTALSLAVLKQK